MFRALLKKIFSRTQSKEPVQIHFEGGQSIMAPYDMPILDAAKQNDVDLDHYCGGTCSCGTCVVEILSGAENLSRVEAREQLVLGDEKFKKGNRLSCQARVRGEVRVRIPDWF